MRPNDRKSRSDQRAEQRASRKAYRCFRCGTDSADPAEFTTLSDAPVRYARAEDVYCRNMRECDTTLALEDDTSLTLADDAALYLAELFAESARDYARDEAS